MRYRAKPRGREARGESAALARCAVDQQHALVPRQRMLHDGQPEARASGFARAAAVHAVKALGEARQMLGVDADAGVLYGELRAAIGRMPDQANFAAGG